MRRLLAAAALLAASACAPGPIREELSIDFSQEDTSVLVTAETTFDLKPTGAEARARVDAARAAAQTGTDRWSVQFARVTPEMERVTQEKNRGVLERVTHAVRIEGDALQQVFSDANVTVDVIAGEGWRELRMYPGASPRATREQQRHFNSELSGWSTDVARYFAAVNRLYEYMNDNPGRAQYLFAAVINEGPLPVVAEEEQAFVDDVLEAMDEIAARMDAQQGRATTFAEEADLMFNPFPARVTVRVPGEILLSEGFEEPRDRSVVIEPVNLFATIASLEGKWISPDPLASILRDQVPTAVELAAMERRSTPFVPANTVADAIREQLTRPKTYVLRWRD